MLNFTILSENRGSDTLEGEGGLSIFIKKDDFSFLFDTGYSSLFIKNAMELNIDLDCINHVVLSHGHSDHTNGVPYLNNGKTIIMHPDGFKSRYSIRKKEYAGFPITKEELEEKQNVILTKDGYKVADDIYFLGEIPMKIDFESSGNYSTALDEALTIIDQTEDDSGIAIKTDKGLVIMVGCGHRGICNAIERAKEAANESRVYAVLGGFHLRNLEKQKDKIDNTIEYFKENQIKRLYLGHCVTDDVIDYFESNYPDAEIERLSVGKNFIID